MVVGPGDLREGGETGARTAAARPRKTAVKLSATSMPEKMALAGGIAAASIANQCHGNIPAAGMAKWNIAAISPATVT